METSTPIFDVVSYALDRTEGNNNSQELFIDAQKPARALGAIQLQRLVRILIAGLLSHGVQPGDCVLVHMGNHVLYTALFLSIIGSSGVYMGSNPLSQPEEFNHILQVAKPKLIITEPPALFTVLPTAPRKGVPIENILVLDDQTIDEIIRLLHTPSTTQLANPSSHGQFRQLFDHGESQWRCLADENASKSTPAAMFSTSGTSGLPKAAIVSHHAIIAQHQSIVYPTPYPVRRLIALPMFHLFGALWAHIFPVRYSQPLYVLPQFNVSQFLKTVHCYKISETYLVPTMVHIINQALFSAQASLCSLRFVGVAGAPLDGLSLQRFQNGLHPDACAGQIWGMTEVGVAFQNRYGPRTVHFDLGSVGGATPGYEVRLLNEGKKEVIDCDDCSGQLYVRGAGLFLGYQNQENGKDEDGWFCTGDLAYRKDHRYFIVGRKKELIKVSGFQVAPAEIEATLLQHPKITDVAVMGVTLADGSSEAPRAYIVRTGDTATRPTKKEVYGFMQSRLASYKALDGGIFFVEQIPRTANGKIQRGKLSQMDSRRDKMAGLLARFKGSAVGTRKPIMA